MSGYPKRDRALRRAFTLIELLVVVTIIALLMAVLLPSLRSARLRAMEAVCGSGLRTLGIATLMYASDQHGHLPDLAIRRDNPTSPAPVSNLYFTYHSWIDLFEQDYGITRPIWYSPTNESWNQDDLYHWGWNGADPETATHSVVGRMYYASTKGNGDWLFQGLVDPLPAEARPLFAQRLSTRSYHTMIWSDLNCQYPARPASVIDWTRPNSDRLGSNHLYNGVHQMPAGSHVGHLDGRVAWMSGIKVQHRSTLNNTQLFW